MRKVNTEKMDKVTYNGQEIAFGKVVKNEWNEYVVKVYVDGIYDEDKTIYADSREDAEATKAQAIRDYAAREDQKKTNKADRNTRAEVRKYIKGLEKKAHVIEAKINRGEEIDVFENQDLDALNGAIIAATAVFHMVYGQEARI